MQKSGLVEWTGRVENKALFHSISLFHNAGMDTPTITQEADMLALMREAPTRRYLRILETEPVWPWPRVIFETDEGEVHGGERIASIGAGTPAEALLDRAHDTSSEDQPAEWATLPIRSGPYCGCWVLPDHPQALEPSSGEGA